MKNYFLFIITGLVTSSLFGQLRITAGAQWITSGAPVIILNDIDLINDGTMLSGSSTVKFTGNTSTNIGGSTGGSFYDIEMAKTGNNKVSMMNNINVKNRVAFTSGLLDLNNNNLSLSDIGYLFNETENSRITGNNGGEVSITVPANAPAGFNPGNLGAIITSAANLGFVTIRRSHNSQSGSGLTGSIKRYFNITPSNNMALDATFRYHYFDTELNGQSENSLRMFKSIDGGTNWMDQNFTTRNTVNNYVENSGINIFSRWTLSAPGSTLPATGLQFNVNRISNSKVLLAWTTNQEFNNKGFSIQRRKENETDFTTTSFFNSIAPGGNSSTPLQYAKTDTNGFAGISYYRLKQEDIDGRFTFSVIRLVKGSDDRTVSLKVWPIPSAGDVHVSIKGVEKDMLQVFDMKGRLMQQFPVLNTVQKEISGLLPGSYFIRLFGQQGIFQKIIIQ